jgi:hypothetical protein
VRWRPTSWVHYAEGCSNITLCTSGSSLSMFWPWVCTWQPFFVRSLFAVEPSSQGGYPGRHFKYRKLATKITSRSCGIFKRLSVSRTTLGVTRGSLPRRGARQVLHHVEWARFSVPVSPIVLVNTTTLGRIYSIFNPTHVRVSRSKSRCRLCVNRDHGRSDAQKHDCRRERSSLRSRKDDVCRARLT